MEQPVLAPEAAGDAPPEKRASIGPIFKLRFEVVWPLFLFFTVGDMAYMGTQVLMQFGFSKRAALIEAFPLWCGVACLLLLFVPRNNHARFAPWRIIGRASRTMRCMICIVICGLVCGGLFFSAVLSVQSARVEPQPAPEVRDRIARELYYRAVWSADETEPRVLFAAQNRAAVEQALQAEGLRMTPADGRLP